MGRPDWTPSEIDMDRPSASRMYDYFLGGSHNFEIDRMVAEQALRHMPELPMIMRENRAFLRRAVRYCVQAGVVQFLDLGSGIPTVGNVHEVAQRLDPAARVVYVDTDPVAVAHSQAILAGNARAATIEADLRDPDTVFGHPELRRLLDLRQPVAVLIVAVLHFVPDSDDPVAVLSQIRRSLALGSLLAISHGSYEGKAPQDAAAVIEIYTRAGTPFIYRSQAEISAFFDGFDPVDPGIVRLPFWRPDPADQLDDQADRFPNFGGLAKLARRPRHVFPS